MQNVDNIKVHVCKCRIFVIYSLSLDKMLTKPTLYLDEFFLHCLSDVSSFLFSLFSPLSFHITPATGNSLLFWSKSEI